VTERQTEGQIVNYTQKDLKTERRVKGRVRAREVCEEGEPQSDDATCESGLRTASSVE